MKALKQMVLELPRLVFKQFFADIFPLGWWKKPLAIALGVSLLIHGILLAIRWQQDSLEEKRLKTPLSVVLINSHSYVAPLKPKRLAQADLNGGGDTSNSVASALKRADPGVAQKLESLQKEQTQLLSTLGQKQKSANETSFGASKVDKTERDPFEAELAQRLVREGQQPRKAILTATSAKSVVYAQYYDAMRRKVEKYGTDYFPRANGQALYGSLIILVSVSSTGKLLAKPEIKRSSGIPDLDRQALAIVEGCAPFGRFSGAMARQLDVIDWIATFDFMKGANGTKLELKDVRNQ